MTHHPDFHAARSPDHPALIMADTGAVLTYAALVAHANQLAQLLVSLGCQEGDCVAIMMENQPRFVEACWAAKNAGLHYVSISKQLHATEIAFILQDCGARVFLTSSALADLATAVVALLEGRPALLMAGAAVGPFDPLDAAMARQSSVRVPGRKRGNSLLYSSGTTGRPKGIRVPLSDIPPEEPPKRFPHLVADYGLDARSVFLVPGPFYHVAPQRLLMSVLRCGGTVIGFERFDAALCLASIARFQATSGFFVPTMFTRMLKLPEELRTQADVRSLRFAIHGAAPCPIPVKEAMIAWWGPVLHEMYGGSEGVGNTGINSIDWLAHKGSVGRPRTGSEVHVVDKDGNECAPGQTGLIYLWNGRSFDYLNDPVKTEATRHPQGWVTLGDIGHLDAEGYLYLTDRQSHMIITGGVNVYPQEVETVLQGHPLVEDVAVIGVPHDELGESVHAVVQTAQPFTIADGDALRTELLALCRARLGRIKCPRGVEFVTEPLPRSDAGKLLKKEIRRAYWNGESRLV